jgi:hypothetical protein
VLVQMRNEFGSLAKLDQDNYLKGFLEENKPTEPMVPGQRPRINDHKFLFIAGLHKSGTSLLSGFIKEHPEVSGFAKTGFPQDEGQFLQSVYPTAITFGGPGLFGFNSAMHLTEDSPLATEANRRKLVSEWSTYWDLSKPVLLEKSPPNLLKTRFLQALFPNSYFLVVVRHPGVVSLATQKWIQIPIIILLRHWLHSYNTFLADREHLRKCLVIRYEDLVREPDAHLKRICNFVGIEDFGARLGVRKEVDDQYFNRWQGILAEWGKNNRQFMKTELTKIEEEVQKWSYSLFHLKS